MEETFYEEKGKVETTGSIFFKLIMGTLLFGPIATVMVKAMFLSVTAIFLTRQMVELETATVQVAI